MLLLFEDQFPIDENLEGKEDIICTIYQETYVNNQRFLCMSCDHDFVKAVLLVGLQMCGVCHLSL